MKTKDKRTDNRHREHDKHGMENTHRKSIHQPGKTLWQCPCDYVGWLFY